MLKKTPYWLQKEPCARAHPKAGVSLRPAVMLEDMGFSSVADVFPVMDVFFQAWMGLLTVADGFFSAGSRGSD